MSKLINTKNKKFTLTYSAYQHIKTNLPDGVTLVTLGMLYTGIGTVDSSQYVIINEKAFVLARLTYGF